METYFRNIMNSEYCSWLGISTYCEMEKVLYGMNLGGGDPVILSPRVWAPGTLLDHTRGAEYLLDSDHHHWYDGHKVHRRRDEMLHKKQVVGSVEAKSEFIPYMEPCPAYDPASQHRCNWDHLIHIWYQFLNPDVCGGVKNSPITYILQFPKNRIKVSNFFT